ncbi:15710_t:CDS:2, partial [Funneliformis geosporum]
GQPYTLASDIYSFSMIMWEFISGVSPFDNEAHDFQLSLDICKDLNTLYPFCTILDNASRPIVLATIFSTLFPATLPVNTPTQR